MSCEELQDLYELYTLGLLEAEEKRELDEHLARECPVCSRGIRRALAMNAMIESFVPEATPPKRLRDRVLASVGGARPRQGFAWWPVWALASAGLLVATLTFWNREREVSAELASARSLVNRQAIDLERARQIFTFLDQPETKQVGFDGKETRPPRGNVFVNPNAGVLLIAQNMPRIEPGKTFQMWVIPKGQNPRPAGLFRADERGSAVHLLAGAVDVRTVGAVAVTVEPDGGSAQPTSTPFIVAPVSGL